MILYVDSSVFAKRYLGEAGPREVEALVRQADIVGTALITRPEISAAITKLVRWGSLDRQHGEAALKAFRRQWVGDHGHPTDGSDHGRSGHPGLGAGPARVRCGPPGERSLLATCLGEGREVGYFRQGSLARGATSWTGGLA